MKKLSNVLNIFPSDANFLLVKFIDAKKVFDYLIEQKVIVRDRSKVILCENSLRISVGSEEENHVLINLLNQYKPL